MMFCRGYVDAHARQQKAALRVYAVLSRMSMRAAR